jgi:hypothetical protein
MQNGSLTARVLFSTSFSDAAGGMNGGHRRARQLLDLLRRQGEEVTLAFPVRDTIGAGLRRADWSTVADYMRFVRRGPLTRLRVAASFARNYGDWRRGLERYPRARVLVWEDTANTHTLRAAKDAGLRVVAVPQNIESLVPGLRDARTGQSLPWSLEHEVHQLSRADRVYTISREEQWLLRLRGVAAEYLPFFPDPPQRQRWLNLRRERRMNRDALDRYLVLGSAVNPPTRAGMAELLTWLTASPSASLSPVKVIGYGTEIFRDLQNGQVEVLGTLNDEALEEHLLRARAVILHQPAAVGALIRVSEMLLAGVPIFANAIAARSTSQYHGVVVYESFAELGSMLTNCELPESPPVPEPSNSFERSFLETIFRWISP